MKWNCLVFCPITYAPLHGEDDQTYQNIVSPSICQSVLISVLLCEYGEFEVSKPVEVQPVPFLTLPYVLI